MLRPVEVAVERFSVALAEHGNYNRGNPSESNDGKEGGDFEVPLVHVKEDESFENALRRFKRKCEKSGILSELKKRQHYEKPSEKRKRKAIAARKKVLRKLADERRGAY